MARPLMPKATAVWLIQNTTLTFEQIADFCGLHPLEVQSIADGETAPGMVGFSPVNSSQVTMEEIGRCQKDPDARLRIAESRVPEPALRAKGPRYTPVARRQDKPDAIAWLVRYHAEISDSHIARLIGTTKPTIKAVRDRSHWNITNIKARDPVALGLCSRYELESTLAKMRPQPRLGAATTETQPPAPEPAPEEAAKAE